MGETGNRAESELSKSTAPSKPVELELAELAVRRILDANLDRAREGVRIIEEWCRFGLNSTELTEECKQLRQELAHWHTDDLRKARDTANDPGVALSHPQEEQRSSISQVLRVNFCRTQEALRVLEEYGKLRSAKLGAACKQMRYRVYELESRLTAYPFQKLERLRKLERSPLYLVTSPVDLLFETVEAALKGGLTLVQYRDKTADDQVRLMRAEKLKQLCQQYDALFIINDRPDLALAVGADGVHLGQEDLPIAVARMILGNQAIIGRSTHCADDLQRAIAEGADYIGVGPVYATPTKAGRPAAGLDYVRYAAEHSSVPWFAIGGIDTQNLFEVIAAGAERVSVVRAIMEAEQPTLNTQFFMSQMQAQILKGRMKREG
ncbi:MAG: thiamine phosphate synthase [Drouetiella hepatica Uher 2000/2452]|jgi:thiamine-phosphate pyrophosphorylase|uniref:Thiamine-phosphate synthase n=1 Tax=Drouetiella hepatica Uher 2000/2452 TaxID=904376 RepID=A0A951QBB2_9CYAN|nr:thiamine phosphate synthase [Drouetiella hepatica Uher 2000/2452]